MKEKTKILNIWRSTPDNKVYYDVSKPIHVVGDWAAYACHTGGVLYTYKNIAVSNVTLFNKDLLERLAANERYDGKYDHRHFLFDRAMDYVKIAQKFL